MTFLGTDLLRGRDGTIGRAVARFIQGIIVMSAEMQRVVRHKEAHVIPFGVNQSIFYPIPMATARQKLGLSARKKYILFPWSPDRPERNGCSDSSTFGGLVRPGGDG